MRSTSGFYAFAFIILTIGVPFLGFGAYSYSQAVESNEWPTTDGIVIASYVDRHYDSDDDSYSYTPIVEYQFSVNGITYNSDKLEVGAIFMSSSNRDNAQEIVDRYPEGSTVTVYYDPDNPDNCALIQGVQSTQLIFLIVGIVACVLGLGVVIATFILGRRPPDIPLDELMEDDYYEEAELRELEISELAHEAGAYPDFTEIPICPNCDAELMSDAQFCTECGANLG